VIDVKRHFPTRINIFWPGRVDARAGLSVPGKIRWLLSRSADDRLGFANPFIGGGES
jgi:hypothetical protein